ncbi:MAG: hypothetical protein R2824_24910 [Saprospiraceae bacterium]
MPKYFQRRDFNKRSATAFAGLGAYSLFDLTAIAAIDSSIRKNADVPPTTLARDENFWKEIQKFYRVSPDFINLKNGYYSMDSDPVLEAQVEYLKDINAHHSYYMRRRQKRIEIGSWSK